MDNKLLRGCNVQWRKIINQSVSAPISLNPQNGHYFAGCALVSRGKAYAVYIRGIWGGIVELDIPSGRFRYEFINTINGEIDKHGDIAHDGHLLRLEIPQYTEDIALRIILL